MTMISRFSSPSAQNHSLQAEPIWNKLSHLTKNGDEEKGTAIGKAAEVFISAAGKKLAAQSGNPLAIETSTSFDTPAESALSQKKREADEREEYKKQAKDIETQIAEDTSLSDEDKTELQKQADDLWEKGKTDEDKLHDLYQSKRDIHKDLAENDGTYTADDMSLIAQRLNQLNKQIDTINNPLYGTLQQDAQENEMLEQSAILERANIAIMRNKAKIQGQELDERSSEAAMSIRTPEQIAAQAAENSKVQPTSEDVIRTAASEGQEHAEKADSETERLSAGENSANLAQTASRTQNSASKAIANDLAENSSETAKIRLTELRKQTE